MNWKDQKYTVIEEIADHGSKAIYRCIDNLSGEPVIAKVLGARSSTYEAIMRIKKEYQLLSELSPVIPGIVRPIQLEERGGYFVLSMEDINGESLKSILRQQRLDVQTVLRLAIKLVDMIGAIHEREIIHKDIKPANLIWNRETDQLQLIDFDLSTRWSNEKSDQAVTGIMEGSLPYISPEQTGRINRHIDYRSDFYSFGVVLYEMLTGTHPYPSDSVMDQIYSIIAKKPVSPAQQSEGRVPQVLSNIVMKLLEKSPEDRYRSAYGIRSDLKKCLSSASRTDFEIGLEDRSTIFHMPQKLYGREEELNVLQSAFVQSMEDRLQLALVAGEAGSGKTALVNELQTIVSYEKGYFVQGKFEQYNKNIPYSAIMDAFRTLLAEWLNGPADEMADMQYALKSHLGANAGLMTRWLPELEQLIGVQPKPEPLLPVEENNRFFLSFVRLLESLIGQQRPLVLFLDDLQWADLSSIQLMSRLLENKNLKRIFIIGSYRYDEIGAGHSLSEAMERLNEQHFIHQLHIQPLSAVHTRQLIEDTMGMSAEQLDWLTPVIHRQTGGNPFFTREILKDLYKQRALYFDQTAGAWLYEEPVILELTASEDLIEYLMEKMKTLPAGVRLILSIAALIGRTFDWQVLRMIGHSEKDMLMPALLRAVQEEILLPLHTSTSFIHEVAIPAEELDRIQVQFTFQHDKLQQALYQMIDPKLRQQLHLQLGWLLLSQWPEDRIHEHIMEITGHLNKGIVLVTRHSEKERLIHLNLQAARRAKEAFGYETARRFLQVAISLITEEHWQHQYERTWDIYLLYSECSYLIHQPDSADRACNVLLHHARTGMEQATIYEMQSNHYMYLGLMGRAIEAGKAGLDSLDFTVPRRLNMAVVAKELLAVKLQLRGKKPEQLLEDREMTDQRIKLIMRLLVSFIPPAFISGEQTLFGWAVLKKTQLSIRHGNAPESAGAYIGYAMLLSGMGDLKGAEAYGRLAVSLNEKFADLQWRSLVHVLYSLFCYSWSHDWETLEEQYRRTVEYSLLSGDMLYLAHACYYRNQWNPSLEIETYLQESGTMLEMIENTKYRPALATARLNRQKFRVLSGEIPFGTVMDDEEFSEQDYLDELGSLKYYSGIGIYYICKIQLAFMTDESAEALTYIQQADQVISTLAGSTFMEEYSFYTFMALASCYPELGRKEQRNARIRMSKQYRKMKKWAAHHPHNFTTQQYLMQAEWLRIHGKYSEAENYYYLALQDSEQGNFTRYKAIASEQIARFYLERGRPELGGYYFKQASYYYSVWGARGKVQQLQENYQDLMGHIQWVPLNGDQTMSISTENIDIHLLLQASQAISREIELDQLLHNMMNIVLVNAGAQRGCIMIKSGPSLWAEGEYSDIDHQINIRIHEDQQRRALQFPWMTMDEVARSRETLMYTDASSVNRLSDIRYMTEQQPRSVLCMPLLNQDKLIAVIYLENNLITGAFTRERLGMINLLSRDMVYAIENASLYSNLEHLVNQRTRELAVKNEQLSKYFNIVDKNVIIVNTDLYGNVMMASEEFCLLTGYTQEEVASRPHRFFRPMDHHGRSIAPFVIDKEETWNGELIYFRKDQNMLWLNMTVEPAWEEDHLQGYMFIGHNITDKKQIERISITDELTGLYNRRYFNERILYKLENAVLQQASLTFMLLDIDHYKKYNDRYGHYEGDNVLRRIGATLLEETSKAGAVAFRLGGEEFAILSIGMGKERTAEIAENIRQSIEDLHIPHDQNDAAPYVTVSVGVGFVEQVNHHLTEEAIYRLADAALYRSKASNRNCVTIHTLTDVHD
ncbi:diguanylate cyclase [Paenibacillus dauci]|uniref:diguanylate cyclase n=1 Tax=Paenibacillus dauci TaxID=1567106 RepID=UPI00061A0B13|nr:diguanylate cyclase [Paenibacillus dauci]